MIAELLFWLGIGLLAYTFVGYPALVAWLARRRGRAPLQAPADWTVTVVIAAYNEERRIAARVRDVLAQDYPADRLKVLVVSDGSQDATAQRAAVGDPRVEVIPLPRNVGKAAALNEAMTRVATDLVVFTDARQRFSDGALRTLTAAFADPGVGAVTGELMVNASPDLRATDAQDGTSQGVGLYWRMEKALRAGEARLGWLHGVSGSIHAMRRPLFQPMPAGTVLDDMWLPMHVLLAGKRVWMARGAIASDHSSATAREEFSRKVRTLAGNWQLLARLPVLMHPLANPVFFAWFSHKFLRLLAPWVLLVVLAASVVAVGDFYRAALAMQLLAYAWAAAGLLMPRWTSRIPLVSAAGAFLLLNTAALVALPAWVAMQPSRLWKKH